MLVQPVHDLRLDLIERLLSGRIVLEDLQENEALLGANHVGELILLKFENGVFNLFRELAPFEDSEIPALFRGLVVGMALGDFRKIVAVLYFLEHVVGPFLQGRDLRFGLAFRADEDFPQGHLLRAHKFPFVLFVVFLHFVLINDDPRSDLAADDLVGQKAVAKVVFEIFVINPLVLYGLLQGFHVRQLVLLADLVEFLDELGLDGNPHVLGALHQERLIDQVPESILVLVPDQSLQLFRSAPGAFLAGFVLGSGMGALQVGKRDDFIVYPRNNFLDDLAGSLRRCRKSGQKP